MNLIKIHFNGKNKLKKVVYLFICGTLISHDKYALRSGKEIVF